MHPPRSPHLRQSDPLQGTRAVLKVSGSFTISTIEFLFITIKIPWSRFCTCFKRVITCRGWNCCFRENYQCMEIKKLRTPFHQPFSFEWWNFHFLIAAFTFTMTSGGMGSILWAVFACSAILVISSASVGAEIWNPQFLAKHTKDGIFYTNVSLFYVYLCLSNFADNKSTHNNPIAGIQIWGMGLVILYRLFSCNGCRTGMAMLPSHVHEI